MAARIVVENEYFRVTVDDALGLVRFVRTPVPYGTVAVLEQAMAEIDRAMARLPRTYALLLDARDGPMRNDPEFEAAFARARRPILARFTRIAVLVKSAVGKLQVQRYAREDNAAQPGVFDDEAEALRHLGR